MKFEKLALNVLKEVGGKENVAEVAHCITRLRFKLKDNNLANQENIKAMEGVLGVVLANNQFQVIIGNEVVKVYDEVLKLTGKMDVVEEKQPFSFKEVVNTIASLFTPLIPALAGSGIIKGLLTLAIRYGWMENTVGTYQILNAAADSVFYFMPIMLAYSCAKKFKVNIVVSMVIGASLIYPNLMTFMSTAESVTFLGLPVIVTTYTSSVIPIILSIFAYSFLERFLTRFIPKALDLVVTPAISIAVMVPATLLVFGPFGNYTSDFVGKVFTSMTNFSPLLAGALFGGAFPIFVMFGMHRALVPIGINEVATLGGTSLWAFTGPSNFAQSGASFAVAAKVKNKEMKSVAFSAGLTALCGITEPALYGVTLKYKMPLAFAVLSGAIGGAIAGIAGAKAYAVAIPSILTIPAFIGDGFMGFVIGISVAFVLSFVLTFLFGVKNDEEVIMTEEKKEKSTKLIKEKIVSPLKGEVKPIEEAGDQAFASKALGNGCVIIPNEGTLYAPVSGKITALFPTNHAIGITTENGVEVLIHIGVNTVELNGQCFESKVKQGDIVEMNQELITFDIEGIKKHNYSTETFVVITNTNDFIDIILDDKKSVEIGENILTVI